MNIFAQAVDILKPGGCIGNVNYLGSGEFIKIPRIEWAVGMGHKRINAGLTPGGCVRMEKLASLVQTGKYDPSKLITHRFEGFDKMEDALLLMKDVSVKPIRTECHMSMKS